MFTRGWMLIQAPCVEWYLPADLAEWPAFRHMSTALVGPGPVEGLSAGTSCWAALIAGRSVGLAWDWVEIARGVPALSDPNTLVSNLQFLSRDGEPVDELGATVCLSRVLHELPWQGPVRALLREARPPQAPMAPQASQSLLAPAATPLALPSMQ